MSRLGLAKRDEAIREDAEAITRLALAARDPMRKGAEAVIRLGLAMRDAAMLLGLTSARCSGLGVVNTELGESDSLERLCGDVKGARGERGERAQRELAVGPCTSGEL